MSLCGRRGLIAPAAVSYGFQMRPLLIAAALLLTAAPALAQSYVKDRLAKLGQPELVAGDGPTYRVVTPADDVLLLTVAGDGRATLTIKDKAGRADSRSFSNRELDALDAALTDAKFLGDVVVATEDCKTENQILIQTIIDGRYREAVRCNTDPRIDKVVGTLRGR
jgi:hypothetical protein